MFVLRFYDNNSVKDSITTETNHQPTGVLKNGVMNDDAPPKYIFIYIYVYIYRIYIYIHI